MIQNNHQNSNHLSNFDIRASESRRFAYQMTALGMYLAGAAMLLSLIVAPVAFGVMMGAPLIAGLIAGGVVSLIIGGGFSSAKSSEFQKQQQYTTLEAANQQSAYQLEKVYYQAKPMQMNHDMSANRANLGDKFRNQLTEERQQHSLPEYFRA